MNEENLKGFINKQSQMINDLKKQLETRDEEKEDLKQQNKIQKEEIINLQKKIENINKQNNKSDNLILNLSSIIIK
jgi:hypothetical protein